MDYLTATAAWLLWTVAAFTAIRSACSAPYSSVLDEALVKDVLKLSSSACTAEHQDGSFSSTFDHTPSLSPWSQSATREKAKFLAALKHTDPDDPSKNWEMRVGPGGDVYSFRGAYGPNGEMKEVVPPQSTEGTHGGSSAWNDDVFTMVAVDQQRNQNRINGKGWYIHQAGPYADDQANLRAYPGQMWTSPSVAKYCDDAARECGFVGWGQIAEIPSPYKSRVLFYTRIKDCGGGVIEIASGAHNMEGSPDHITYLSVPWSGMRPSVFPGVLFAKKDRSGAAFVHPLPAFDLEFVEGWQQGVPSNWPKKSHKINIQDFGGYTMFATDRVAKPAVPLVNNILTAGAKFVIAGAATYMDWHTTNLYQNRYTVRIQLEATITLTHGCYLCHTTVKNQNGKTFNIDGIGNFAHKGTWLFLIFYRGSTASDWNAVFKKGDTLSFFHQYAVDASINQAESGSFAIVHGSDEERAQRGQDASRLYGAGRLQHGYTMPAKRDSYIHNLNAFPHLRGGVTYTVNKFWITGKYGSMASNANSWVDHVKEKVYGSYTDPDLSGRKIYLCSEQNTDQKSCYLAYCNTHIDLRNAFCGGAACTRTDQATACYNHWNDHGKPEGRAGKPDVCARDSAVSASVEGASCCQEHNENLRCTGSTVPQRGKVAIFAIRCGASTYIGEDYYHFAPASASPPYHRAYICAGHSQSTHPSWKLLGFFKKGACANIQNAHYDPNICHATTSTTKTGTTTSATTKVSSTTTSITSTSITTVTNTSTTVPTTLTTSITSTTTTLTTTITTTAVSSNNTPTFTPTSASVGTGSTVSANTAIVQLANDRTAVSTISTVVSADGEGIGKGGTTQESKSNNGRVGKIVGGSIGGILLVAIVIAAVFVLLRNSTWHPQTPLAAAATIHTNQAYEAEVGNEDDSSI